MLLSSLPLLGVTARAGALELTFDPVDHDFQRIDQGYGDRVTTTPQDGMEYGTAEGFTPNVETSYGPIPPALPSLWRVGYGDLVDVLFEDQDSWGVLEVTFTADPQWNVALHGFDMAAYRSVGPIRSLQVRDGAGTVLFTESDVSIPAVSHRRFEFDPPLEAHVLVLAFDSGNLGQHSDDIGMDNIAFSQVSVPLGVEPSSWGRTKALYR
jgi:hypothetical protein